MIEFIENYLISGIVGLVLGIVLTRRYYRKMVETASLGKIIEYSLLDKILLEIESQTQTLNNTISRLRGLGEDLAIQIRNTHDIEKSYKENLSQRQNETYDEEREIIEEDDPPNQRTDE